MGDTHVQHFHNHQNDSNNNNRGSSRLGLRSGGGEIVEVQGGHIVRSTGRKDRHSKVCTAKGPRDRRVRLSAHTAIQFYDVQDRLGYDRPSKAVDWLIKKAKAAIDELAKLPVWNPTTGSAANPTPDQDPPPQHQQQQQQQPNQPHHHQQQQVHMQHGDVANNTSNTNNTSGAAAGKRAMAFLGAEQQQVHMSDTSGENSSSFLPPSLDSDAIADTIKSFFPMGGASGETNAPAIRFHGFAPPPDFPSRTSSQSQDLRLSLQSLQDPILLHHHNQQTRHQNHPTGQNEPPIFTGINPLGSFDAAAWTENQAADIGRFQRMMAWNAGGDAGSSGGGGGGGGGFMFNAPSTLQPLFGQNQFFTQGGPLQSSNTPSIRAWMDPSAITLAAAAADHQTLPIIHPSSFAGVGFASGVGGFIGYHIPARIQGEEEEHEGISDKPSSASSDSRR